MISTPFLVMRSIIETMSIALFSVSKRPRGISRHDNERGVVILIRSSPSSIICSERSFTFAFVLGHSFSSVELEIEPEVLDLWLPFF
jgi:hypothetical protein